MHFLGGLVLAGLLCSTLSLNENRFAAETFKEDDKKIMMVRDTETGMLVSEIDVFEKQEYQLIKPVDDDICLVAEFLIQTEAVHVPVKPACFKRVRAPVNIQEELQIDLSACKDREVLYLKPVGCRASDVMGDDGEGLRQKRGCYTDEKVIPVCVESEHKCTRRNIWGKCRRYVKLCIRSAFRTVKTTNCD